MCLIVGVFCIRVGVFVYFVDVGVIVLVFRRGRGREMRYGGVAGAAFGGSW